MSKRVAIVGVAESDLGITGKSVYALQVQAITAALEDAGLDLSHVDGLATNGSSRFAATQLAEYLGIFPRWFDTTFAGGSSYEIFVSHAAHAIREGACEVAVISYGSNQRSMQSRQLGGVVDPGTPEAQYEAPYGLLNPISGYALAAQRYLFEYGTTSEQLAGVAVAARAWALKNPKAFHYRSGPLTVVDVLASPMVSSPLHALDCCLVTDGGGAVVLVSEGCAASLAKPPVWVLGHGEESTHQGIAQMPDLIRTGANASGARAFGMAGLAPRDIDVIQVYDSFTITVLLTLEALGFCGPGEAAALAESGALAPGGRLPVNTSGGGLSYCHPGMFGILLLIEATRQLRGECGNRQLPKHETAVCHGTGGMFSTHATVVLGRG
jgi:acetyl-CoA acetyltransferase